jgi:MFS transporter, SET family, sugar efflux transporter
VYECSSSSGVLLLVAVGLLSAGTAAFPQIFALARTHHDRAGDAVARRRTPALRSTWSFAWAIGPMIGAALLASGGYHRLLLTTALAFALVAGPLVLLGPTPRTRHHKQAQPGEGRPGRSMLLAAGSLTCFHTAVLSGSVVLPLYVTGTLHKPDSKVGMLFTVCAIVEIPVALATMMVPPRLRKVAILAGMASLAVYFVLVAASTTVPLLLGTQVARGIALASAGTLGITYVQDLAPRSPGRATTMFANTVTVGSLVSGLLAGAIIQALGFRPALLVCAALTVAGGALLLVVRPEKTTETRASNNFRAAHGAFSRRPVPTGHD